MRRHRYTNIQGRILVQGSCTGGQFKSALERDRVESLAVDPDVFSATLQQPKIHYVDHQGRKTRYTGDVLVRFRLSSGRRPLVVETKYEAEVKPDDNDTAEIAEKKRDLALKFEHLTKVFGASGLDYRVDTDAEVYAPETRMARFIFGYINVPSHSCEDEILSYFRENGPSSLDELLSKLRPDDLVEQLYLVPSVWKLVARHYLRTDYSRVLNREAIISSA